jgi:hypothetical protein
VSPAKLYSTSVVRSLYTYAVPQKSMAENMSGSFRDACAENSE